MRRRLQALLVRTDLVFAVVAAFGFGQVAQGGAFGDIALDWRGQLYGYGETYTYQGRSILNPDNDIANLPQSVANAEGRFDINLTTERFKVYLRPILVFQGLDAPPSQSEGNQLYLSQASLGFNLTQSLSFSAGRELLTWGPSQFRSPSNPFYFNSGRNNPNLELSGIDIARVIWTPNQSLSLWAGWVSGSGHEVDQPDPWEDTWVAKLDWRGFDWSAGLAVAKPQDRDWFVGIDLQRTQSDAWLLYAEASTGTLPNGLSSPLVPDVLLRIVEESPRREAALVGTALTLENGQTLNLEYLYYGHGYSAAESSAYFSRAAAVAEAPRVVRDPLLGAALGLAPPLLGQNYLYLVWQNNLLADGSYWRLMAARNLDDSSNELSAYGEYPLNNRVVLYALGVVNTGGPRREMESVLSNALSFGLRVAVP